MEDIKIENSQAKTANKYPLGITILILCSLITFFTGKYTAVSEKSTELCEEKYKRLEEENKQLRQKKEDLYYELLVSNGIIKKIPQSVDSLAKQKKQK